MSEIRVLLADDHAIFRQGVKTVLDGDGFTVVGEAGGGREAVEQALVLKPDIILMDLHMPGEGGLWATRQLSSLEETTPVVILTYMEDDDSLFEALKAGARGYLLKSTAPEELRQFLRAVVAGEAALPGALAARVLREFARIIPNKSSHAGEDSLTQREEDVLQLLASGHRRREIAEILFVSENTVKAHMRHIMEKLHLRDRLQLALYSAHRTRNSP